MKLMGLTFADIPVELVALSVGAREQQAGHAPEAPKLPESLSSHHNTRPVYDPVAKTSVDYHEIKRDQVAGQTFTGPAVITESQTTTLVRAGWSIDTVAGGHLLMERISWCPIARSAMHEQRA